MVSLFSGFSGPVEAPLRRYRGDKLLSFTASSRRNGARAARCAAPTVLQGHIGIPERAVLDPPLRRIWKQSLLFRRGRSRTGPTAYAPGALAREPMCRCGTAPAAIFANPGPSGPMRASGPTKLRHKFTVRRNRTGPTTAPSSVWPNGQPPSPRGKAVEDQGANYPF